jgi:2-polyprenyl-6-methoxyphenol hydroxylase-like FAD-dependent oxidoreductase
VRAYLGLSCAVERERLQGAAALASFVERSIALGVPATYFEHAEMAGPLATFDATDNWVDHPYRDGIALVGDAAATSDPTWGQGMAHTLRDVRVLAEKLAAHDDWNAAGDAYAREHDRGREATHTCDGWYTDLLLGIGPDADARRARALPRVAADPSRLPDTPFDGPEITPDERARRRLYGEE